MLKSAWNSCFLIKLTVISNGADKCFNCTYAKVGQDIHGDEFCKEANDNSLAITCDQPGSQCVVSILSSNHQRNNQYVEKELN